MYNHSIAATSSITGAGGVGLTNVTMAGTYNVTGATSVGGLVDFTGTVTNVGTDLTVYGTANFAPVSGPATLTIPNLTISGTLKGTDDFRVTGAFNWNNGTLQGVAGHGSLTVLSDMTLNGTYYVRDFNLINAGNAVWSGGTVQFFGANSLFANMAGATFTNTFDGTFGSADGNCIEFLNEGLFVKSGNTGTTFLQMQLYNRGTVQVQQGQLYLGCGYVSNNPTPPGDGIIYPPGKPPEYRDPDPGPPGGDPVVIPGNYTQSVTGVLIEQIAGHTGAGVYGTPGTDYGQLVITGNVALNGSLQVQLLGGFLPTLGQQFLIINNLGSQPVTGTFTGLAEGAEVSAGSYIFTISYVGGDGNDVVLTAVTQPRVLTLSGLVFSDFNNDGEVNFGERAIAGVIIKLSDRFGTVIATTMTNAQGIYEFTGLASGQYYITEEQPSGFAQGTNHIGTLGGTISAIDQFFVDFATAGPDSDGMNYNFAERPSAGGNVQAGQTASIGFWQNKHGQALITGLNGGSSSTQLGNWLAATFPNMYGADTGAASLADKTNTQVAAFYVSLFKRNGQTASWGPPKVDAQVLATALAVYVTNSQLAGNNAAAYGFQVSTNGVGYSSYNVSTNGAAFGVANGSSVTVMDLLLAVNLRTRRGLLFDTDDSGTISTSERTFREMANTVFSGINEVGNL